MIGFRIAALRRKTGMSQEQLAQKINVCASTIGMYEQGRREPSLKITALLSQVFEVSLDYLITGTKLSSHEIAKKSGILIILQDELLDISETHILGEAELTKVLSILPHLRP